MTIYAVGDLHGNLPEFRRVLRLVEADGGPEAEIVWLGDYADRGPATRQILDAFIAGRAAGRRWHCLLGNHDRMMLRFLQSGRYHDTPALRPGASWFHPGLGGMATLASYGIEPDMPPELWVDTEGFQRVDGFEIGGAPLEMDAVARRFAAGVPAAHVAFLESLPLCHETEMQFFVHAGVRPGVPLAVQAEDDLVWIREPFLSDSSDHGKLVVHGHTPVESPAHAGNRVAVDTGAGYGRAASVLAFEGADVFVLSETGRLPLAAPD